ncbi:MAG: hemolysin family protein [Bacteroidota bacterium]
MILIYAAIVIILLAGHFLISAIQGAVQKKEEKIGARWKLSPISFAHSIIGLFAGLLFFAFVSQIAGQLSISGLSIILMQATAVIVFVLVWIGLHFAGMRIAQRDSGVAHRLPSLPIFSHGNLLERLFSLSMNDRDAALEEKEAGSPFVRSELYEQELIRGVLDIRELTVRDVMVPRTEVVAVDIRTPRDKLLEIVTEEGYSRIPVYDGTIDNVLGVIYTKDLIALLQHRNVIVLEDVIRPAYFVPETKRLGELLKEMQTQHVHLAVVIDEFGGVEGIVTLEDILEEIVGEIRDEYDEEPEEIIAVQDGGFLVDARTPVRRLNERFGEILPESDEYDTIGGFVASHEGRIPRLGEAINVGSIQVIITKRSKTAVKQVKLMFTLAGDSRYER